MIVYDTDCRGLIFLSPPQPAYAPVYLPFHWGITETNPAIVLDSPRITLLPEYNNGVHDPDIKIHVLDVPWRYYCESCHYAFGNKRGVFHTDWTSRRSLGLEGMPSRHQMDQINDHAKQHSIMWSWAKGLEKK